MLDWNAFSQYNNIDMEHLEIYVCVWVMIRNECKTSNKKKFTNKNKIKQFNQKCFCKIFYYARYRRHTLENLTSITRLCALFFSADVCMYIWHTYIRRYIHNNSNQIKLFWNIRVFLCIFNAFSSKYMKRHFFKGLSYVRN